MGFLWILWDSLIFWGFLRKVFVDADDRCGCWSQFDWWTDEIAWINGFISQIIRWREWRVAVNHEWSSDVPSVGGPPPPAALQRSSSSSSGTHSPMIPLRQSLWKPSKQCHLCWWLATRKDSATSGRILVISTWIVASQIGPNLL